jgi:hypothetical protein
MLTLTQIGKEHIHNNIKNIKDGISKYWCKLKTVSGHYGIVQFTQNIFHPSPEQERNGNRRTKSISNFALCSHQKDKGFLGDPYIIIIYHI